jgi:hypothetical protein
MFVGKDISFSRIDHFMKNKYNPLCNTIGKFDACHLFFSSNDFIGMMTHFFDVLSAEGVRVYIATYSGEGEESVPKHHGELLTLIFSPTSNANMPQDIGVYYHIIPNEKFDNTQSQLNKKTANDWVLNYQRKKLLVLNATVNEPAVGDTKSLHFTKKQLKELIAEIECQGATGIKTYFASINPEYEPDADFKKRLVLQFVLTMRIGAEETEFSIEDRDGFPQRPQSGEFDTGNPCPPAHCDTSELPYTD